MASKGSVAPLEWLRQQDMFPRWYWASRDTDEVVAACGASQIIAAEPGDASGTRVLDALRRLVPVLPPEARLFGGLRFDTTRASDPLWRPFDQHAFVIPALQLRCRGSEAVLTRYHLQQQSQILCHSEPSFCHPERCDSNAKDLPMDRRVVDSRFRGNDKVGVATRGFVPPAKAGVLPHSVRQDDRGGVRQACPEAWRRDDRGSRACQDDGAGASLPQSTEVSASEHWQSNVSRALRRIEQGELAKVVLAHKQVWRVEGSPLDPLAVFATAAARSPGGCFRFFWQPCPDRALVGWSPERLYARAGSDLQTEAVAGTRPRCDDATRNAAWADELTHSDKDRREHDAVARFVRQALCDVCDRVDVGAPRVVPAATVQHLKTPMRGRLRRGVTDADILARLHPTPAVCGTPSETARECIARSESFDRGYYAGPVGWLRRDGAEFAAALRCGVIQGNTLHGFAGAGLVAGSEPAAEWAEVQAKLGVFAHMMGLRG